LLLLNAMGYYAIFLGLEIRNDSNIVQRLDADNYDFSRTITIKIPITIPYMPGSDEFKRVDGKFLHNGEHYRLVKQKYLNDTLTVICFRDHESTRIKDAMSDYVKTFTDSPPDQKQNSKLSVSFIKDFIAQGFTLTNTCPGWQTDVIKNSGYLNLIPSYSSSLTHPPERG
jgi:hypothetical protein